MAVMNLTLILKQQALILWDFFKSAIVAVCCCFVVCLRPHLGAQDAQLDAAL